MENVKMVFAVVQYTRKPGSEDLLGSYSWDDGGVNYSPVYSERKSAEMKCSQLNAREEKDEYSNIRYRVQAIELLR